MVSKYAIRLAVMIVMFCFVVSGLRGDDLVASSPSRSVDPLISTGGNRYVCGHNSPAATVPFGLVRLGPDTISSGGKTAINTVRILLPRSSNSGFQSYSAVWDRSG